MKSSRIAITIASVLSIALLFVMVADVTGGSTASAKTAPGFKLGVFVPSGSSGLSNFESAIGRKTDTFLWYESIGEDFDTYTLGPIAQSGHTIQLAWEPQDPNASDPVNQPAYSLKNITAGNFDTDIQRWARQMRNSGYSIIIRPMCEMNGDWLPWGGTVNGNSPQDYVPAWRHIHDIFVQEGASNVKWVWSPNQDNTYAEAQNTFNTYYPGDAYVDYVGINGYNWGTMYSTPVWSSQWKSFTDTFAPSYDTFTARTSKPVIVCETASTELGGDKAAWITDTFAQLPARFPRIVSLVWFNINKETDWRVESSPASLAAFKAAVAPADNEPPVVSISSPAPGATLTGDAPVSVSATDNVGIAKVELYASGTLVATSQAAPYNFTLPTRALADGPATLTAKAYDQAGNSSTFDVGVTVSNPGDRDYFFGWYDSGSPGMQSWVVIANPGPAPQHVEVYIAGQLKGSYDLGPGQRATPAFPGVVNGPVKVASSNGGQLLVSERTLFNGSFSELPAFAGPDLGTDYYLAWYDEQTPGMHTWVVVANQGSAAAEVDIQVAGQTVGHYSVPAGGKVTPEFPGVMDGPLHVSSSSGQPLVVSERVRYGEAFNETAARAASSLTGENYFTWYDNVTPGMRTWIVAANQGSQDTGVDIYVAGRLMGSYQVPAGGRITPSYPGTMDGPVRVVSTAGQPLIVSQRSLYGGSFEEVTGEAPAGLTANQWFAWYDSATPGMTTWLLIANQGSQAADVNVTVAGQVVGHYSVPAGGRATPVFSGQMGGPVQVQGTGGSQLVVSQRVIYQGSFDEVLGRSLT